MVAVTNIKRKAVTDFILEAIDDILPDGFNRDRMDKYLNSLSDEAFEQYLKDLHDEKEFLSVIAPNGAEVKLDLARNFAVAKKYNIPLYRRLWLKTPDNRGHYLTQDEYLILRLPVRRQSQILDKKKSIPDNNKTIDNLTGQPAGSSKGAKISYPEVQMLAATGLNETLTEFLKYRGGDKYGMQQMNISINNTGGVSLKAIEPYSGRVKSTDALHVHLTSMHLKNNL